VKRRSDSILWASVAAFALLSAATGAGILYPLDRRALALAQGRVSETLDLIGAAFSALGDVEHIGVATLTLCAVLLIADRKRLAWRLLAAFVVTGLLEFSMKMLLPQLPMPEQTARSTDPSPLVQVDYHFPYPSGHMLRSVILLGAIFVLWPNRPLRAAILSVAGGMALTRVYLGVHWVSDVVGGALLGVAAIAWVFRGGPENTSSERT
jgi:undecaprenyl-diphosphatase